MKYLKTLLWIFVLLWMLSFNFSNAIDFSWVTSFIEPISNFFDDVTTTIWSIWTFLWSLIQFIGSVLKLVFGSIINFVDHVTWLSWMHYFFEMFAWIQLFLWVDIIYFELAFVVCIWLVIFRFIAGLFSLWKKIK